ncbi:MAG TPA: hypothetical protein VGF55_02215 [Gemmataceae bacterium]|jgi:hypothetical protein
MTMRTSDGTSGITAAFVIGVEASQEGVRPPARYAAADAAAFADALGTLGAHPTTLLDGTATKTTIESRLRRLSASDDDTLAVYFAGYVVAAGGVNYLVVHDTQPDDLIPTAVPLRVVVEAVERSPCRRGVLFFDPRPLPDRPAGMGDFAAGELGELFGSSEKCIAFVSRSEGEEPYVSDALKHGVWAHLVLAALAGDAPAALDARHRLTPRSLQRYLTDELPRVLRQVLEDPAEQTPAHYGRSPAGSVLADLGPTLRNRRAAAELAGQQLERVVLWAETRTRVKDLAGFQKTHHVPDRVRPATVRFAATVARDDLQADLDAVYAAVREHLGYRRKDVTLTPPTDGAGALRTPEFDYLASVALAEDDPTTVVIRREVTHVRSADVLRRPAFQAAFGSAFQALSFEYAAPLDVEGLVDRLEEEPPTGVRVRCAADASWCELDLTGFPGTVRVERCRLDIVGRRIAGANTLWAAFEAFQQLFNRATAAKALPPAAP